MKDQFPSLEEALKRVCDIGFNLSRLELYALSGLNKTDVARFRERWETLSPERRREVMQALVESAEANFEMDFALLFRSCLADQDEQIRFQAIEGLWECEEATLVDPLVRMLRQDPSAQVRAAAALSLARFALQAELEELDTRRGKAVTDGLLEAVRDANEDIEGRRRAMEALAYLDIEGVHDIIEAAYSDDDPRMRASAVFAMGRSCDTTWNGIVLNELSALEPEMRYEAARAAGELKIKKATRALIKLVEDPDREVQEAAIWALGQVGGSEAKRVLEACAETEDEELQEAVQEALGELALGSVPLLLMEVDENGQEQLVEQDDEDDWDEDDWDEDDEDEYEEDDSYDEFEEDEE